MWVRAAMAVVAAAGLCNVAAQTPAAQAPVAQEVPDCGSLVIVKCERREVDDAQRTRREAARRIETRRGGNALDVMDKVIIEDDAIRPDSPEAAINRALSRPLAKQGEYSFSIGESAQCTCMNICPPPPFPCCQCTDRVGSRHSTAPGWAPTR
jgi:hypothetical protein